MTDRTFWAEDGNGCLRRWHPSAEQLAGPAMAAAIRGRNQRQDVPALLEMMAGRLSEGKGNAPQLIAAARESAELLRRSLPKEASKE